MPRYGLDPSRMETTTIYGSLYDLLYVVDPENPQGYSYKRRAQAWREMRSCISELELRGDQLELPLGKGE